ncbi:MAG: RNA polymerase sigma factor [bacterium]
MGDRNEAEDLALEVFLRVYQAAKSYKAKAKFTTWLYKITTNLCLNEIRKKAKFQTISLSEPISIREGKEEELVERIADSAPSPQEILEKRERDTLIRKAIDSLPAKQRMAAVLQIHEGLSYIEISAVLGCSVKSVERCLYWARTNLKEKLKSYLTRESSGGF